MIRKHCHSLLTARQHWSSHGGIRQDPQRALRGPGVLGLLLLLVAWGCSGSDAPAPPVNSADDSIAAALAELTPEERDLAETQGVCPVSNQKLGSMGKPYAAEVKGRKVFLCCQGCEETLRSDPDKYLAILDEG